MATVIRWLAPSVIALGGVVLVLGVLLFQAAHITNATSDFTITVTWAPALTSTLWPLSRLPFILLLAVAAAVAGTAFLFFATPRAIGVPLLLIEAGVVYWFGGWLGWHFLTREFTYWSFSMDGEKLGEYWFSFESLAVWSAALGVLVLLRLVSRRHIADDSQP